MKQKELTEKQKEILERLGKVLNECVLENIGLVFDEEDCSLTAYNAENVNLDYCGRQQESENDERINWDLTEIVNCFNADYFNNGFDSYYLNFDKE